MFTVRPRSRVRALSALGLPVAASLLIAGCGAGSSAPPASAGASTVDEALLPHAPAAHRSHSTGTGRGGATPAAPRRPTASRSANGGLAGGGSDGARAIAAMVNAQAAREGVRTRTSITISVAGEGTVGIDMAIAAEPRVGALAETTNLSVALRAGEAAKHATVRVIVSHGVLYSTVPAQLAAADYGGRPWVAMKLSTADAQLQSAPLGGGSSPTAANGWLAELANAPSGVTDAGSATIDGVATTAYRAELPLRQLATIVPSDARSSIEAIIKAAPHLTMPITVWIDPQHRLRRMTLGCTATIQGHALTLSMRENVLGYGPQSLPATPPAGQTTIVSSLPAASTT